MTEAEYGAVWAKMAYAEGHRQGVPTTPNRGSTGLSKPVITACILNGMTLQQIADALGCTHSAVKGFCNRNGISTKSVMAEMREAS